eukprot:scaffold64513_cov34-Phaeocystis_antarctica.AAC.1
MACDQLSNGPVAHGRPPRARASQGSVFWQRRSRHDLYLAAFLCHPASRASRAAGRPTTRCQRYAPRWKTGMPSRSLTRIQIRTQTRTQP